MSGLAKSFSVVFFISIVILFSCAIENQNSGTLILKMPGNARSVSPAFLDTLTYRIDCEGHGSVSRTARAGEAVSIPLAAGDWNVTVTVFNAAEQEIGRSAAIPVTIEAGKTTRNELPITLDKSGCDITQFRITSPSAEGTEGIINQSNRTISVSVPAGTNVSSLRYSLTHTGREVSPASAGTLDFSTSQTFTVTAEDGVAAKTYTVTVNEVINIGIEMVWINPGTFTMGSPASETNRYDDENQHQVAISKGFWMSKYEVMQEKYQSVTGFNPSYFSSNPSAGETQSRRPVEQVTWYDAVEFCNKLSEQEGLTKAYTITNRDPATGYPITSATVTINWETNGYRLPTEAEWEYACRAGTTTAYSTGNTISDNTGWYGDNSGSRTHEVGKKLPNAWGLYDMHGNVWEWCWDWYGSYTTGAQTDPRGALSGSYRVRCGGSWNSNGQFLRSAYRGNVSPLYWYSNLGFRLLRPSSPLTLT